MEIIGRVGALAGHVHDEVSVRREERRLPVRVTTIGAMGVSIDELTDRQPVRGLLG